MNLLLLLSALLSALSGVGQAVRGGRAPQAVCASVSVAQPVRATRLVMAWRPVVALPRPAALSAIVGTVLRLVPAEPIFAGRRRE